MNMKQLVRGTQNITAALIKIKDLNLLLPQGEIRTLESATDIDSVAPALHSIGWVSYAQKRWPVYNLSEDLQLMNMVPPERRACALMSMGAGYIGIMCDDMIILKDIVFQHYEIPPVMQEPQTPVMYLLSYKEGIACATNANRLTTYIGHMVENA